MNIERLKVWRDALLDADTKGRIFHLPAWVKPDDRSPCGFAACAAGDLALYGPAQKLGMSYESLGRVGSIAFGGLYDDAAILEFLEVDEKTDPFGDETWVCGTIHGQNGFGVYRDACGRQLPGSEVTRDMVLARIEAKIQELETR